MAAFALRFWSRAARRATMRCFSALACACVVALQARSEHAARGALRWASARAVSSACVHECPTEGGRAYPALVQGGLLGVTRQRNAKATALVPHAHGLGALGCGRGAGSLTDVRARAWR